MQNYVVIKFLWTFPYYLRYFAYNFQKTDNFAWNFISSQDLCFRHHIDLYIQKNQNIRNEKNKLLLGKIIPRKAVCIQTIWRWLVNVLSLSYIYIYIYIYIIYINLLLRSIQGPFKDHSRHLPRPKQMLWVCQQKNLTQRSFVSLLGISETLLQRYN